MIQPLYFLKRKDTSFIPFSWLDRIIPKIPKSYIKMIEFEGKVILGVKSIVSKWKMKNGSILWLHCMYACYVGCMMHACITDYYIQYNIPKEKIKIESWKVKVLLCIELHVLLKMQHFSKLSYLNLIHCHPKTLSLLCALLHLYFPRLFIRYSTSYNGKSIFPNHVIFPMVITKNLILQLFGAQIHLVPNIS